MTLSPLWPAVRGIAYGGDYNPEQWSRETWTEDVALMREGGVTLVSVGIFSWALIEVDENTFDFSWLDELLDLLHSNGIAVDLGTPTASPPAWFFARYPDARVINRDGVVMGFGARGMASPSSEAYRTAAVRIASTLAERYSDHPAVVMWHVHNEYGVPVGEDYSEQSVRAFRSWLRDKYGDLDGLNAAWGTAFWGQHYIDWDHVGAPAAAPSVVNPSQRLDFARFTDHQLLACYVAERDAIREHAAQPITTNFMANQAWTTDLWAWGREVDIVADDHYLWAADEEGEIGLSIAADLSRSVGGGAPWIIMEHSTSAVNWQPRNHAKRPGELARNSLAHVARGADAVLFFQWRASRSGAEKFHSAMLPHAGTRSRVWREVAALGGDLPKLDELRGSRVKADVAVLWDFASFWAQDLEWRPSNDLDHRERIRSYYERLWRDDVTVDFALPGHDLSGYRLVVAPAQYLLSTADAANLTRYVEGGGTLVVSFFSAVVDERDVVHEGGFAAPLRDVLGTLVDEHLPQREGATSALRWHDGSEVAADLWQEDISVTTAEVVAAYTAGPLAGQPAVTRNRFGAGTAWYVSTRLGDDAMRILFADVYATAGVHLGSPADRVEVVTRRSDASDYVFAINHSDAPAQVTLPIRTDESVELLTNTAVRDAIEVAAGAVAIVRVAAEGSP
ncbi:beta-galactosidase [Marisediminicola sp. LYQ134]|uniref:beta-galactosidase n=1 Tax=Marisediminicola sp. LYQ134 TaxID=3391061 RepID=UPI0039831678